MLLRNFAYKILMKSGLLTREVITHDNHETGEMVKDARGRIFRVLSGVEIEYNGMGLTRLYGKERS